MHIRIITSVAASAALALSLSACDKKPDAANVCQAVDGSTVPCPVGGAGGRSEPGAPEQQK